MKYTLGIITSASAVSILALAAPAQETPKTARDAPAYSDQTVVRGAQVERLGRAEKASDLIGMEVKNNQNEKLGKVDDLAVDMESGRIVQVILSTGGFIGIGDTLHAVPPGALRQDVANKVILLDADKEKLKAAPAFETTKWAECCDSNHVTAVYRHYGQQPYFTFTHKGDGFSTRTRNPDGTWASERTVKDQASNPASCRLGYVQKASKLMGTAVKNLQDETLGKVDNLMVDLPAGRLVAVIVSSGGFLGMGDELSAVPPTALRFNAERDTLQLDSSKEALSNAPHFKANQWPDFGQPTYADGVYRAYRVEPYFNTNAVPVIDNTERPVRDRDTTK